MLQIHSFLEDGEKPETRVCYCTIDLYCMLCICTAMCYLMIISINCILLYRSIYKKYGKLYHSIKSMANYIMSIFALRVLQQLLLYYHLQYR